MHEWGAGIRLHLHRAAFGAVQVFVKNSWMGSSRDLLLPRLVSGEVSVEGI